MAFSWMGFCCQYNNRVMPNDSVLRTSLHLKFTSQSGQIIQIDPLDHASIEARRLQASEAPLLTRQPASDADSQERLKAAVPRR